MSREVAKAARNPAALVRTALRVSSASASVSPNANAMFGPRSGATTMAPMIAAALFCVRPTAATTAARTLSATYSRVRCDPSLRLA